MTVLYPKPCYNKVQYKGTVLHIYCCGSFFSDLFHACPFKIYISTQVLKHARLTEDEGGVN